MSSPVGPYMFFVISINKTILGYGDFVDFLKLANDKIYIFLLVGRIT